MSRSAPVPPPRLAALPALPLLREPDVSGLALWSALLMAGSVLLAFLATAPVQEPVPAAQTDPTALTEPAGGPA